MLKSDQTTAQEKTPPGFEGVVQKLKTLPIENPWALAWWMHDKDYQAEATAALDEAMLGRTWDQFKQSPEFSDLTRKYPAPAPAEAPKATEGNSGSSLAQLTRPVKESAPIELRFSVKLFEADKPNVASREIPVTIISEGMGNAADKHFYTREALQRAAAMFEGAKCYADHPKKSEAVERPERSVRDIVGYYHDAQFVESNGVGKIRAILKINPGEDYAWAWELLNEAVQYSQKFPDRDYVGISINANGVARQEEREGQIVNMIERITRVTSADIVTQPGAGGKPLRDIREAALVESDMKKEGSMKGLYERLSKLGAQMKEMYAAMDKSEDHKKAYGEAMGAMCAEAEALTAAAKEMEPKSEEAPKEDPKPEGAPAPAPAASDAPKEEPKKPEESYALKPDSMEKKPDSTKDLFASEAERFASGKMSEGEKKLFEAWAESRAADQIKKSKELVEQKLSEAGLPAAVCSDLRAMLVGQDEKIIDETIKGRKALMESLVGNRAKGAGSKGPEEAPGKLLESLAKAGVPMKEGGK